MIASPFLSLSLSLYLALFIQKYALVKNEPFCILLQFVEHRVFAVLEDQVEFSFSAKDFQEVD